MCSFDNFTCVYILHSDYCHLLLLIPLSHLLPAPYKSFSHIPGLWCCDPECNQDYLCVYRFAANHWSMVNSSGHTVEDNVCTPPECISSS